VGKPKCTSDLTKDELEKELTRTRTRCYWLKVRTTEITTEIRRLEGLRRELFKREEHYRSRMESISRQLVPVKVCKPKGPSRSKGGGPSINQMLQRILENWDQLSKEQKDQLSSLKA